MSSIFIPMRRGLSLRVFFKKLREHGAQKRGIRFLVETGELPPKGPGKYSTWNAAKRAEACRIRERR